MTKKQAKVIASRIMGVIESELNSWQQQDQIKILEALDDLLYSLEEERFDSYRP